MVVNKLTNSLNQCFKIFILVSNVREWVRYVGVESVTLQIRTANGMRFGP